MRTCPQCAKKLDAETASCPHCGIVFEKNGHPKPHTPKKCPECSAPAKDGALCCAACGLIFFTKPAQPLAEKSQPAHATERKSRNPLGVFLVIGGLLFLVAYYLQELRWIFKGGASTEPHAVAAQESEFSEFDFAIDLQTRPYGMTWNEKELVIGNRDAGTFMKLSNAGNQYVLSQQFIGEIAPLSWNGKDLVGYKESGIFQSFKTYHFTLHDGFSLNVREQFAAPEAIGGIVWDGSGYWAASRKPNNTDRGFLYRLNERLKPVNKLVAPSASCAGLAWDHSQLWFLDDLEHKLFVLNLDGIQARVLESYVLPLKAPAGIAFDGQSIWIADRHTGKLFRVRSEISEKWIRHPVSAETVAVKNRRALTNFARFSTPESQSPADVQIDLFSAEVQSGVLFVSWDIRLSPKLMSSRQKKPFGKFTVTVDGGNLSAPVVKVFDANQSRIFADRIEMLSGAGPGIYTVRGFLYREYTDIERRGRIFTHSIAPLVLSN